MKKTLSILLATILVFSAVPMSDIADFIKNIDFSFLSVKSSAASESDLTFTLNDDGNSYSVKSSNTRISGEIIIPSTYNSKPVTSIADLAFSRCNNLTSITIPDSVTNIGEKAFYKCDSLISITIPDSVTSIGYRAFNGCSSLTSITVPDSVTNIGNYGFYDCSSLTSINVNSGNTEYASVDGVLFNFNKTTLICYPAGKTDVNYYIPESVTDIYGGAFYACGKIISITIPDSVTSIGDAAFYACNNLTSITMPGSVTSIGEWSFYGCSSLTSITIPNSVTSIGNVSFYACNNLTSITIPDSVTSIGDWSFYGCSSLTSVTIGDGVTSIGDYAFKYCNSLTNITIPVSVKSIGNYAFYGCNSLANITIPDGVTSMGYDVFYGTAYYNDSSNWENGVLYIGKHLIVANKSVSGAYTVKDGTKTIAGSAFRGCSGNLLSITIPNSVTSIGDYAFYDCRSLTNVTIGNSVTSIGDYAFCDCSSLTNVTIGNSVTSIGDYAFYDCSSLTSITIPDSVTNIGDYAFYGCSSITSITIGDGVTSIGDEAFRGCSGLTKVKIPVNVTSIGEYAFSDCSGLTTITIPDSVNSIGRNAFSSCSSLTSITIPDGVTSIGNATFYDCNNLISITIPDSVTDIGLYAFEKCSSLTSITIPDGVTSIEYETFSGCSSLTTITLPDSVTVICHGAFSDCSSLVSITIPDSVTQIYNDAFSGCKNLTIKCVKNSYAHKFAFYQGINYEFIACKHNYTVTVVEPTCEKKGYTLHKCSLCGNSYEDNETATIPHSLKLKTATVKATCTKTGKTAIYKCENCDYTEGGKTIAKTSHTYKSGVCTVCGDWQYKSSTVSVSKTTIQNGDIKLTWNKLTGAKGYEIYKKTGSGSYKKLATIKSGTTVTYTDKSVKSGTKYAYYVKAYNGKVYSKYKASSAVLYLAAPKLSKVTSAKAGITVQWGKVTGASGYIVYRKTSSGKFTKLATVKGNTKVSYLDKSAKKGTTYTYTVAAYNGKTYSAYNTTGLKIKDKY